MGFKKQPSGVKLCYYRGLNIYQYHLEVHLRYHIHVFVQGIWNHNVGNYLGAYIMVCVYRVPQENGEHILRGDIEWGWALQDLSGGCKGEKHRDSCPKP